LRRPILERPAIEIFTAGRTFFPLITPVCRLPPPAGLFDSII
jgi:hypothetical protein